MFLFLSWTCFSLPATFSLVGATLGANRHSMGVGIQSVIKRLPIMVAPIVGGILIDRFGVINGVRIGLIVSIFLSAATILVQRQLREAPAPAVARSDRWTFWQSLRGFNAPLRRLLLSDILVRFCERIPYAWVVIYAMDDIGVSAKQVGILTTVEMLAATLCIIPASHFADKHGREPFILVTFRFLHSLPDRVLDLRQLRLASARVRHPRTEGIRRHFAQSLDHRLLRARAARPNDRRLLSRARSPREFGGNPRRLALEAGTFHELSWRSRLRRLRHPLLHLRPPARSLGGASRYTVGPGNAVTFASAGRCRQCVFAVCAARDDRPVSARKERLTFRDLSPTMAPHPSQSQQGDLAHADVFRQPKSRTRNADGPYATALPIRPEPTQNGAAESPRAGGILSSGVSIKGSVKFEKELLIDGEVEGKIDSHGRLTIGEHAKIRGEIRTKSVIVDGTVDGNITAGERCELRAGCTVRGDIESPRLVVDEAATFIGSAKIATKKATPV